MLEPGSYGSILEYLGHQSLVVYWISTVEVALKAPQSVAQFAPNYVGIGVILQVEVGLGAAEKK